MYTKHTHIHQAPKVPHTLKQKWGPVLLMSGSWSQTALCAHTARLSPYTP